MNKLNNIKDPGFKIPENYFNDLEDAVFNKLSTDKLKATVNDSGFVMPENYLSSIEGKVFNTINGEDKSVKVISIFNRRNMLYLSGIAAAVLVMFSVFINKDTGSFEDIDFEMVEDYILSENINSYELASLLTDDELQSLNSEFMDEAFNDMSLEDYLLDNVDVEDIIEQ